jgi:CDK inhibitor PHO81
MSDVQHPYCLDIMTLAGKFTLSVVLIGFAVVLFLLGGEFRQSAFTYAASNGHTRIMSVLLALGANVNASSDENSCQPIFCATYNGQTEAVRFLLNHGAKLDVIESVGWTPLMDAAAGGHTETVRLLLSRGARVNAVGDNGSALRVAMEKGKSETANLLKQNGAKDCRDFEYDRCL